jgi:hypothetical protein
MKRPEPKGISKKASIAEKVKWAVKGAAKDTAKNAVSLVVPAVRAGSAAAKIGDKVAQKVAESMPAPKLGKAGGEVKTVRTNPKDEITVRRNMKQPSQKGDPHLGDLESKNKISISKPKSATYTTPENSMKQRMSVEKRMTDKRNKDIEGASKAGEKAAEPEVNKLANTGTKGLNVYRGIDAVKTAKGTQKDHYVTDRKNSTRKVKGD